MTTLVFPDRAAYDAFETRLCQRLGIPDKVNPRTGRPDTERATAPLSHPSAADTRVLVVIPDDWDEHLTKALRALAVDPATRREFVPLSARRLRAERRAAAQAKFRQQRAAATAAATAAKEVKP
jgi:hypothetical protein